MFLRPLRPPARNRHLPRVRPQRPPPRMRPALVQTPAITVLISSPGPPGEVPNEVRRRGLSSFQSQSPTRIEYPMLKLRLTHKRAKRWGRRAKSDGSCVPKLKRVKIRARGEHQVLLNYFYILWAFGMALPMSAVAGYVFLGKWNILPILGFSWSTDTFGVILYAALWSTRIGFLFFLTWMVLLLFSWRKRTKWVIACRCHVCPRCSYDLSQRTDDTHPCPECGQRISRRECIRLWARFCR